MSDHALLSASGAHKWLNCTPSARLEETMPEAESMYADEGRLAHEIGELKLRKAFTDPMGARTFNSRLKKLQEKPLYQEEMLKHTDAYLEYVSKIVHGYESPPFIAVEKRLDYSNYAPEGFGTGDCIIIGGNVLHIIDLKYGKGVPVSAVDNPQMMLYGLGALDAYSFLYPIDTVRMAIFQPRLDSVSEFEMSAADLRIWGEVIKPFAQLAFSGEGDFNSGEHCRFCRAKALCRARADYNISLEEYCSKLPPLISIEEVGQLLEKAQHLAKWVKDLEDYALAACLRGEEVPGWKAVAGRSIRQFTDQEAAFKVLTTNGIEEVMLYERKPLTLAAVETLIGKPKFKEILTPYVFTPDGKPTLVLASDKREAIKRPSAADDFKENGGNANE